MKKRGKLRIFAEYFLVRLVVGFIGIFPIFVSIRIGELFGRLCFYFFSRLRRTAFRNLELALPETTISEREEIAKGVFKSLGRQLGIFSHLGKINRDEIFEVVEIVGKENFDKAFSKEKGILFFTGHFGGWEISSLLPQLFGYKLSILVRRIDNPMIEAYVDKIRTRFGTVTLDKRRASRQMFRILANGGLVGMLADLNVQERDGIFVDFFGIKASTTPAIAKLALKTKASLIPVFVVWDENKRKYVTYVEPELEFSKQEEVTELTQKVTSKIEEFVRRFPDQWLWIHKRWNTRPPGEPRLY